MNYLAHHILSRLLNKRKQTQAKAFAVPEKKPAPEDHFTDSADNAYSDTLRQVTTPADKRFTTPLASDLERFGTPEGIIDVSNDLAARKKQRRLSSRIARNTSGLNQQVERAALRDGEQLLQVTVANQSADEREVQLWGATDAGTDYSQGSEYVRTNQVTSGAYPQGVAWNPVNHCVYVANQLAGTVSVLDAGGHFIQAIDLGGVAPGLVSPVSLCVVTNPASSRYGYVYVACAVSDSIAVISPAGVLESTITLDDPSSRRPVHLALNQSGNGIYIVCSAGNNIALLVIATGVVIPNVYTTGQQPVAIAEGYQHTRFVVNHQSSDITVYDAADALVGTFSDVGLHPLAIAYNPSNHCMYVTSATSGQVTRMAMDGTILATITVAGGPAGILYNSTDNRIYVLCRDSGALACIQADDSVVNHATGSGLNLGAAFNPEDNRFYFSDTATGSVSTFSYTLGILITGDYVQAQTDFRQSPAIVTHVRFVVSGSQRPGYFTLRHRTPTGLLRRTAFPYESYTNPQARLNVADLSGLEGNVLDGKSGWSFRLPGLHRVTILVWYRQVRKGALLEAAPA